MREVIVQMVDEAKENGWAPLRQRPGPKHVVGTTKLDKVVSEHMPEVVPEGKQQKCRGCGMKTRYFCPGCAKRENCGPASGFYCMKKDLNCMRDHHKKLCRARVESAECEECEECEE